MKKFLALVMAAVMMTALLAGCAGGGNNAGDANNTTGNTTNNTTQNDTGSADDTTGGETAAISGTVNTDGSTSMADVMAAGTVDIGLSSRALTDEEKAEGAVENIVALDGVAIVVHPENTVTDLTIEQIAQIYTGEITNWSELGGADAPIAVIGRDAASGTRGAFEEIVGVEDACVYTNEYESTGEVIGSVAGNPNAIGYASLSAVDDTVVAVQVNGVAPSEATVADGTYEIQRPFVMVTVEGTELSEAAQAFLEWAMSADAADEVEAAGCVSPNA